MSLGHPTGKKASVFVAVPRQLSDLDLTKFPGYKAFHPSVIVSK
jgi:hypothetical protein